MKKYFWTGFLTGVFFLCIVIAVLYFQKDASAEPALMYEGKLSIIKGYERLSNEEKQRIEDLTGEFQIGDMRLYSSGFYFELYEDESYVDKLVGQEIDFKDINDVIFDGEQYQVISIDTHDAEYYFLDRYTNALYCFGEKSVVEMWFHSLDDGMNAFAIIIAANGNIFFKPGALVRYGDGNYTVWGIYEVLPCTEKEDYCNE